MEVPAGRVARGAEEAVAAAGELGYPVAIKLSSAALQHKSEAGALALDVHPGGSPRGRRAPPLPPRRRGATLLVEAMGGGGPELLFAARRDGVVPVLVVGLGGVWAEAIDDVALVPLPASPAAVERALRRLRGAALFTGGRGRPACDLAAAARFGSRLGELLLEHDLDLLEVNPAVLTDAGTSCVALDALARRTP